MEFTSPEETAVCNLGSLALPKFIEVDKIVDIEGKFSEGTSLLSLLRNYESILRFSARNFWIL
jgi:hypothetical protein